MEKEKLSVMDKDILTEIGSICAGNAATALAQLLNKSFSLQFPGVKFVNIAKLPYYLGGDPEEVILGLHMQILGGIRGNALMIFPRKEAFALIGILIGPLEEKSYNPTELGISALKEMGNVVISSYLSALSAFTGVSAFSSTVNLASGASRYLVNLIFTGLGKAEITDVLFIEAVFQENTRALAGKFYIIFDAKSIVTILKKAKGLLEKKRKNK
ncbi:MAG: chemotaxis protein CheC [Candidatus Omnitrophota bacterium]